jgi:NAD(P)-dependent dehydrogenase (short-subunit alcohol dehydrogenase family)
MRYETEPFGIKVILIEPGTIRTNFLTNAKVGQKTAEPSSPYAPKLQTMQKVWGPIFDKGTLPEEVAKVILKAVTIDNPSMRYMVGDDAIQMIQAKRGMSDLEFEGLVKQQYFGQ